MSCWTVNCKTLCSLKMAQPLKRSFLFFCCTYQKDLWNQTSVQTSQKFFVAQQSTRSRGLARLLLRYKGRLTSSAGCPTAHQFPAVLREWCNSTLCLPSPSQLWGTLQEEQWKTELPDGWLQEEHPQRWHTLQGHCFWKSPSLALLFSSSLHSEVGFHYTK